jgi:hypothetical protein
MLLTWVRAELALRQLLDDFGLRLLLAHPLGEQARYGCVALVTLSSSMNEVSATRPQPRRP